MYFTENIITPIIYVLLLPPPGVAFVAEIFLAVVKAVVFIHMFNDFLIVSVFLQCALKYLVSFFLS
jgi:ABC-type thiamin/hydroxymethylpyrimidine transport system permease subunit